MRTMKTLLCLLLVTAHLAAGEPLMTLPALKTVDGKEFKDVKITEVDLSGVKITHAEGVARLKLDQVPADILKRLGYDAASIVERKKFQVESNARIAATRKEQELAVLSARLDQLLWCKIRFRVVSVLKNGVLATDVRSYDEHGNITIDHHDRVAIRCNSAGLAEDDFVVKGLARLNGTTEYGGAMIERWDVKDEVTLPPGE